MAWRRGRAIESRALNGVIAKLIISALAFVCVPPSVADEAAFPTDLDPNAVVLLLSQNVNDLTPAVLDDHVKKWDKNRLHIAFLSVFDTPIIQPAFDTFSQRLRDAKVDLDIQPVNSVDQADIVVFFDENSSDVLTKHNLDLKTLISADGYDADEKLVTGVAQQLNMNFADCFSFDSKASDYQPVKSLIFIKAGRGDHLTNRCFYSRLLSSLGLTEAAVSGLTIRDEKKQLDFVTDNDLMALKLLYQSDIEPGDSVKKVLSEQKYFRINLAK